MYVSLQGDYAAKAEERQEAHVFLTKKNGRQIERDCVWEAFGYF